MFNITNLRGMRIETRMRYYFTPREEQLKGKTVRTLNDDEDAKKLESSYIAGGNVKWYSHSGKQFSKFFKNYTYNDHTTQQLYSWAFISEKDVCISLPKKPMHKSL